jgi:large subunit ribosomal protein L25
MSQFVIEVEERSQLGKNESRRLRREGRIPAVLYGAGKSTFPVSVDPKVVEKILHSEAGENTLLDLHLKGKDARRKAMIREYQVDPLTGTVVHADFVRIEMDTKLVFSVPVRAMGTPPGVKEQGGVLEVVLREIELECLPGDIPEHIEIDVSGLHIGDQIRVADLESFGGKVEYQQPGDTVVVTLVAPRVAEEEEVAAAEEEEAAEPEVIGKAKTEEEEAGKSESKD